MAFPPNDAASWIAILRQHMDDMFNFMVHMKDGGHEFSPQIDVYETADHFAVEMDLPGFSKDDFTVSLVGSSVRVEGVKRLEKIDGAMSYICLERHFGRFSRAVEIPPLFDPNAARARYERGVLSIVVPRIDG